VFFLAGNPPHRHARAKPPDDGTVLVRRGIEPRTIHKRPDILLAQTVAEPLNHRLGTAPLGGIVLSQKVRYAHTGSLSASAWAGWSCGNGGAAAGSWRCRRARRFA